MMIQDVIHKALGCFQKVTPDKTAVDFRQGRDSGDGASQNSRNSQMPSPEELEASFCKFVAELDLSPVNEKVLFEQPPEKKWLMLCEQNYRQDKIAVCQAPDYYLAQLRILQNDYSRSGQVLRQLEALPVALRTQPHSYVQRFLDLGGLTLLVDIIEFCAKQPTLADLAAGLLACVKALLNSTIGRRSVLCCEKSLGVIALATSIELPRCKVLALEILSGLCFIPDGHHRVLTAVSKASLKIGERSRFQHLLFDLWRPHSSEKDTLSVRTAVMSFVNALLKSEPSECCLQFRVHLRHQFLMLGIREIIEHLRDQHSATLQDHLDLFEMMQQEDETELLTLLDADSTQIDFQNPTAMAGLLVNRLEDSVAMTHLQSLMQHMLLISGDQKNVQLWHLFDLILQQLSLQATMGFVADAYEPLPSVDLDDIIARLHTQSEYDRLQETNNQLIKELDKTKAALNSERKRVKRLQEKLNENIDSNSDGRCSPLSSGLSTPPSDPHSLSPRLPPVCPPLMPPPPPPPSLATLKGGALPNQEPIKRIPKPQTQLKCLNWHKLGNDQLSETVWEGMEDEKMYEKLDLPQIDLQFSSNGGAKCDYDTLEDTSATLRRRLTRETAISVIEPRRAQNCTILLSRLRLSNTQIKDLLLTMDEENSLPKDMIEQLLKFVPTKEEVDLLNDALTRSQPLATADRFLLEMSRIPRYEERLRCLDFMKSFKEHINDCLPRIQTVDKASVAVSNSKRLRKMLALILAIGNYLNYGKRNGNARGFALNGINLLTDVKNSLRQDKNLLHFLAEAVDQKFPDLLRLKRELLSVFEASRVSRKDLQSEIRTLQVGLSMLAKELEMVKMEETKLKGDKFVAVVKTFLDHSNKEYDKLHKSYCQMKDNFNSCVCRFAVDCLSASPDEFFGILSKFLAQLTDAMHKIWKEREESEAIKRRTLARSLFAKKSTLPRQTFYTEKRPGRGADFEQLISALQSGELFSDELNRLRSSFRSPNKGKRREKKNNNDNVIQSRER